ncbi:hypothetical protein IG631_15255 [Alternaria alternata]|nr:hypothetical protein IG631_15255 [Alternaria alternata]
MFRQQQALLRTLPTPSSVVAEALKLWWAWRKNTDRPFLRSMVLVLVAMLFTAVTVAASVFSSFVVDSGSIEVLVDSPLCGRINGTGTAWRTYITTLIANAPVYAGACYRNGSLPALCNDAFTNVNIPLTVGSTPCPFNETMCGTKNAVTVDSGLVDVGKMFGLNLAAKDRVMFRKKVSCTVLPSEGSYEVFDLELIPNLVPADRFIFPGEQILALLYGRTDKTKIESYIGYLLVSNITGLLLIYTSNINVFGLAFVVAFSTLVAIVDITLLKFLVYLTRFRRALGPRIARWTQDGVWQLQRRAYEGEGHRNWTDLENEIPLMEKGHKLKDLPIMWRPGKSPMVKQSSSFASTDSMVSQQSSISELAAEDVVDSAPVVTEQRRSWFSFVRC